MVLVGLLISIAWVAIVCLIDFMSCCGLTISMIITYPFIGIIEKIHNYFDTTTDEERHEQVMRETAIYRLNPYKGMTDKEIAETIIAKQYDMTVEQMNEREEIRRTKGI